MSKSKRNRKGEKVDQEDQEPIAVVGSKRKDISEVDQEPMAGSQNNNAAEDDGDNDDGDNDDDDNDDGDKQNIKKQKSRKINEIDKLEKYEIDKLEKYLKILADLTKIKKSIDKDSVDAKSVELTKILTKLIGTDEFLNLVYDFSNISNPELNALLEYDSTLIQFIIKLKTTQMIINEMNQLPSPSNQTFIYPLIQTLANDEKLIDLTKNVDKSSMEIYLQETLGCMFGFVFGNEKLKVDETLEENYQHMYDAFKDNSIQDFLNYSFRIGAEETDIITIQRFNELQTTYILRKFIYKLLSPITEVSSTTKQKKKETVTTTITKINALGFVFNPPFPPPPPVPTPNPVTTLTPPPPLPPPPVSIIFYVPQPDVKDNMEQDLKLPTLVKFKELCDKVDNLFMFDYKTYNQNTSVDNEILINSVTSLYYKLNPRNSPNTNNNNNNAKYTYTFRISDGLIEVEHNLFGDLFMIRSEIPHDFKYFKLVDLFKQIIDLSIQDYIYTTYQSDRSTLNILEKILTIPLNEPSSAMAVLELIFLSGIPLLKQQKNKLEIEVEHNENDACIFPLIFNGKKVQMVSDADSQGNKYFSQVETLISVLESIYPFLKFDAGSPPTFYSFKELAERLEQLKQMDPNYKALNIKPLNIDVKCLDEKNYIRINNTPMTNGKYTYTISFILQDDDTEEIKIIINYLNSKSDILEIVDQVEKKKGNNPPSCASIPAVISMLNNILKALYLHEQPQVLDKDVNEKTLSAFLQQQIKLYETYIIFKKNTPSANPTSETAKAKFICNILLNIISIKSLGDLVPYYVTLMQIMYDKQTNTTTSPSTDTETETDTDTETETDTMSETDSGSITGTGTTSPTTVALEKSTLIPTYNMISEQLFKYFMELPVEYFGALGSADYSLIQSALINVIFIDRTQQQQVDDCEMVSCVHISNSDITLPISKKEKNIFRLMSCIENSTGSCPSIEKFQKSIDQLTIYSSRVDFMNIKEKLEEIGKFLSIINKINQDNNFNITIPTDSMTKIDQCKYFEDELKKHVIGLLKKLIRNVPEEGESSVNVLGDENMNVSEDVYYEQAILDAVKDTKPPNIFNDDNLLDQADERHREYNAFQAILNNPSHQDYEKYKFYKNKLTFDYINFTTILIKKLEIIYRDFVLFIEDIIELNNVIATTNVAQFFEELERDSKPGRGSKTSNITITNPNIYFLCEYIVRNLNYKLIATPSPSGPLGNTGTAMDFRGGKPKKSTKFKITKKHNKKQYKKRTRKYLHNLK
jgi:hypothetical protein